MKQIELFVACRFPFRLEWSRYVGMLVITALLWGGCLNEAHSQTGLVTELQTRVVPGSMQGEFFCQLPLNQLHFGQEGDSCVAQADIRISLWDERGNETFRTEFRRIWAYEEEDCQDMGDLGLFTLNKRLPIAPGLYRYEVSVTDVATQLTMQASESNVKVEASAATGVLASSLRFSAQDPESHTAVFGHRLPAGATHLFCAMDVWNPAPKPLIYRALLFQKASSQPLETATRFLNVEQVNGVISAQRGVASVTFPFTLEELTPGDYLVEVYLLTDDSVVLERSREFELPWAGLALVYADLPTAIRQLTPIAPQQTIDQLLAQSDPLSQREGFDRFWRARLEDPNGGNYQAAITGYYRSIFAADTLYAEPGIPGWATDRGQCFLQMGFPASLKVGVQGNDSLLFWHYPRFNFWVGFRQTENQHWIRLPLS